MALPWRPPLELAQLPPPPPPERVPPVSAPALGLIYLPLECFFDAVELYTKYQKEPFCSAKV